MSTTTPPRKATPALWTVFALALALTSGQAEIAVPLSRVLASGAEAQDERWQKEIMAWRAPHSGEPQKPHGWLALSPLDSLYPGTNPLSSPKHTKIPLPS